MVNKKHLVWFSEVDKHDVGLVGGKGANLGEMTNAKLPIPYGFIVTSKAYFYFINSSKLQPKINSLLENINYESPAELHHASTLIQALIMKAVMPLDLAHTIIHYYDQLIEKERSYLSTNLSIIKKITRSLKHVYHAPLVAVRSSATAEDLPGASFAGQQETYLNVQGDSNLIKKVHECWASLFTERAIYYRHEQGFDHFKVGLAAVVQRMVQSTRSGIAFSIDPVTNDKTKIVIEAIYGLGEYIVQGKVTPDHYEVNKNSFLILKKEPHYQNLKFVRSSHGNREIKLSRLHGTKQKITDEEIIKVAFLVKDIENHYYFPQDIEWAIEGDQVYIVQSRPITTIKKEDEKNKIEENNESKLQLLLTGAPASPGIGVGPVRIIFSPREIHKISKGDILVAPQTNPDYVPAMKKATAIITEKGGRTSHAAIVSRELGIPAIVGVERATSILKNGQIISVDGARGEIYKGSIISKHLKPSSSDHGHNHKQKTLTRVYVNLAEPELAEKVSKLETDGVGLLRAEFMIANIGTHPKEYIKNKKQKLFIDKLTTDLLKFVKPFAPRPVVYRATDFKTNEYRHLKGGSHFEPREENPMLGFRGASRYIADPAVFEMELSAIKNIWDKGYRNLHLMIPFVRVPWELIKIKEIIHKSGLFDYPEFKLWIMVEVPACALNLEAFIKVGIDGVSIGTNDLTMMVLGVDRDNAEVAGVYDERHPIIISLLEFIVKTCSKHGITASICGQAASDYPEIVEKLVEAGITSVSVTPDSIERTRELIFNIEKKHFNHKSS